MCTNRVVDDVGSIQIGLVTIVVSVQIVLMTIWLVYK